MPLDNNPFDGHRDIAQFLEKFREQNQAASDAGAEESSDGKKQGPRVVNPARQNQSFEKLEEKIQELEERFEASAAQNHLILSELARTREAMEHQQSKNAFVDSLAQTIESLKSSVETLSKAQLSRIAYNEPEVQRSFDREPGVSAPADERTAIYHYQPDNYRQAQEEKARKEREEKERIISSLHQKASQLKAVNIALDREIKKVQQEKMDALKKSAEQAKEILSLREQLSAAEERFKSFDFEGRIISIKQEYQQKVTSLENQLRDISNTCMKQVEEIESLKAENLKLHRALEEKEALAAQFEAKTQEVAALQAAMEAARKEHGARAQKQLETFAARLRALEEERDALGTQLSAAQAELEKVTAEKQTLEHNFKELLAKINDNDAVIENLKKKIDVLSAENTQLVQEKTALTQARENLGRENDELMQKNRALGEEAQRLAQDRARLVQTNDSLVSEKEHLSRANDFLLSEKDNLARTNEFLAKEKETLHAEKSAWAEESRRAEEEKNRLAGEKEALLQEKDALGRRAKTLAEENERLARDKDYLHKQKENLMQTAERLSQENSALERNNETLAQKQERLLKEKELLAREKETLEEKQARLAREKEAAAREKENLNKENRELRSQSAALLAARLAEKKREASKAAEKTLHKEAPAAPKQPAAEEKSVPISEVPVEMQKTLKSKVQTEADLPEIKVADPIPQPEEPFNGEDFLEKTDSFIGRMKWSIFREDK